MTKIFYNEINHFSSKTRITFLNNKHKMLVTHQPQTALLIDLFVPDYEINFHFVYSLTFKINVKIKICCSQPLLPTLS